MSNLPDNLKQDDNNVRKLVVEPSAPVCTKCNLYKAAEVVNMQSVYPKDKEVEIAFIAEKPYDIDEEEGQPMSGETGKNLTKDNSGSGRRKSS